MSLPLTAFAGRTAAVPKRTATTTPKAAKATKAAKSTKAGNRAKPVVRASLPLPARVLRDGQAEARLIEVYRLIGQSQPRAALALAESLVADHPNFQLAQLVYGDLLAGRARPVRAFGDIPDSTAQAAALLGELRQESDMRLRALRDRPPPGMVPTQFIGLSAQNRHAIAVDASRSRLYLFENSVAGLKLVADYYISVGKLGIEKSAEGDLRTPLGVYFVTSNLDPKLLKDFYGVGALPINYPNQLDLKRGKTGRGIWLHGTPPQQFSRPPHATDGCVVLANPDLERLIKTVAIRSTPVVIAPSLKWAAPQQLQTDARAFGDVLKGWQQDKSNGDLARLGRHYSADFNSFGKTLADWMPGLQNEIKLQRGREVQLKDISMLRWTDSADTMVVTFGEVVKGTRTGRTKRQYWARSANQWQIFFEGDI